MGSVLEGLNDKWRSHPAMTAAGLLARIFIDKKGDPWMKVAANEIVKDLRRKTSGIPGIMNKLMVYGNRFVPWSLAAKITATAMKE
jgi:hypothetical protein